MSVLNCFANKLSCSSARRTLANRRHYLLKAVSAHMAQTFLLSSYSTYCGVWLRCTTGNSKTNCFPISKSLQNCIYLFQKRYNSTIMKKFITSSYFVNGEWKSATSTYPVYNPYSGQVIAQAANCTQENTESAVKYASAAFRKWKNTTGKVSMAGQTLLFIWCFQEVKNESIGLVLSVLGHICFAPLCSWAVFPLEQEI